MKPITIALIFLSLAAGCASTPVRYLTLDMDSSGSVPSGAAIVVDEVELSDALRRPELLVQARETEVEYYGDAHWVSNLTELVTEKLEAEFGAVADGTDPVRLRLKVWHFGEDETGDPRCGRVKLSVWAWMPGTPARDNPDWSKPFETCTPVSGEDVSDVAAALSTSLEVIALQIGKDLARSNR